MNRNGISHGLWILALWLLATVPARSGQEEEWRVALDIQMVAISPGSALQLVPRLRDSATFDKTFAEIQQMIERDEAELIAWPVLVGPLLPDTHAIVTPADFHAAIEREERTPKSESFIEERYPTEYIPPQVPTTIGAPGSVVRLFALHPGDMTTPTAFETRNAGVSVTAEAAVSHEGDLVELSICPERVLLLEYQFIRSPISPAGIIGVFPAPYFQTAKVNSRLTVRSGKRILLGTFVESKPDAKVLLFLLKAVVTRTGGKSSNP